MFSGIVHPQRALLELSDPISVEVHHRDAGIKGSATVSIYKNQVSITFRSNEKIPNTATLRNVMAQIASDVINCACLNAVVGYEVELISLNDVEENQTMVFGADIPGLSIKNDDVVKVDILPLFRLSGEQPLFSRALEDFKLAIRHAADTGFHCYRAVESLIHYIENTQCIRDKKKAIDNLNESLNLNPECVERLRDLAGRPRHGYVHWITSQERLLAVWLAREILRRFAAYYSSEKDRPSFPTLTIDGAKIARA